MNPKATLVLFLLVIAACVFVPIIPSDEPFTCKKVKGADGTLEEVCDDSVAYVSVYEKYFK